MLGTFSRAFNIISTTYGWSDDDILNLSLRRMRQILAAIAEERLTRQREERLMLSWQTRSLAMVMARATGTGDEELMKFAANLTIDNEEYEQFGKSNNFKSVKQDTKLPVHATTQEEAVNNNYESAAANNSSIEMLALFGQKLESGKPGH